MLLEQPDGAKVVERFVVPKKEFVEGARVPLAAADLAVGSGGTTFRVGRDIYLLQPEHAADRAGRGNAGRALDSSPRIARAENVHGNGGAIQRAGTAP